ncbi:MAG: hypothetical protein PVH61_29045 [Candidatus Aminicenantes bacterium]|jgi:NRPS condensation-like uncharacterized protein
MNRLLSTVERLAFLVDQTVNQNFVMVATISGPLTDSILRQALDLEQQRHPPLKCKFIDADPPKFSTEGVPQIPLSVIQRRSDEHWLEMAEKEILEPLPWRTGPMVRVVLLRCKEKCDLLVTLCHITADAISGVNFMKNLLFKAGKLSSGETPQPKPPLAELAATHDMIRDDLKYPPEFLYLPTRISKAIHKPVKFLGDKEVPIVEKTTRVVQRVLSQEETKKFVTRCRKEKASVHAAVCAALLQSAVEQIRGSQDVSQKGPLMIGCTTPVNIRHLFSITVGDDIGNFISDALHYQRIDDKSSLWTAARKVKKSLKIELKFKKDIKAVHGLVDLLKNVPTPLDILKIVDQSLPPVVVTNIGRVDIPGQFGDLVLENFHFTLSINPSAPGGIGIAASSFRDVMTLNFHYLEPYLSKARVEKIIESTMKRIKEAIRG